MWDVCWTLALYIHQTTLIQRCIMKFVFLHKFVPFLKKIQTLNVIHKNASFKLMYIFIFTNLYYVLWKMVEDGPGYVYKIYKPNGWSEQDAYISIITSGAKVLEIIYHGAYFTVHHICVIKCVHITKFMSHVYHCINIVYWNLIENNCITKTIIIRFTQL